MMRDKRKGIYGLINVKYWSKINPKVERIKIVNRVNIMVFDKIENNILYHPFIMK